MEEREFLRGDRAIEILEFIQQNQEPKAFKKILDALV